METPIVNKHAILQKGRVNPLTGYIDFIPVTGGFHKSYNMFVVISGNPAKPTASSFVQFITGLIISGFFRQDAQCKNPYCLVGRLIAL
jgi:hypothetical protein